MRTADGSWREVEIVWSDLQDDPAVNGIVLNCRDVTERNELERHLQHAQKLDAVGHLAGGLAHDFNNLLTVIRGYTELLRGDLPPEARECAEDLGYMEQAVDRAATVTKKLLAFSRRQPVQATVVDVNGVLRELEPLFRQLLPDGVEVVLDCTPQLWRIKVDQGQIEQVLINLATNARDAMPQGGRLQIQTENHVVRAGGAAPGGPDTGDYIQLTVSDTGVGMDDDTLAHIFAPFFSTKPKDRGMGLGPGDGARHRHGRGRPHHGRERARPRHDVHDSAATDRRSRGIGWGPGIGARNRLGSAHRAHRRRRARRAEHRAPAARARRLSRSGSVRWSVGADVHRANGRPHRSALDRHGDAGHARTRVDRALPRQTSRPARDLDERVHR